MHAHNKDNRDDILSRYQDLIKTEAIQPDFAQEEVLMKLHRLAHDLEINVLGSTSGLLKKILLTQSQKVKGIYIWGGVGRGKSMLMDLFFESSSLTKKRRVHFHSFMLEVHRTLHKWRSDENRENIDSVIAIAKKIAEDAKLLCFDEFQVTNVADAMILGKLFGELFKLEVIVVATSNRPPEDLYKDGLQRERFEPFIDILKQNVDVLELHATKDYRLSHLKALSTVYYSPLDKNAEDFLNKVFAELTNGAKPSKSSLQTSGRVLLLNKTHADIAWASFQELCEMPLGAADYIEISRKFSTLLLSGIPRLSRECRNEAKRFVTLIDELYERKVKLICTAQTPPEEIYKEGDGAFEFARTVSRLIEMQSSKYLTEGHVA
jgi:cell division protein ZapE